SLPTTLPFLYNTPSTTEIYTLSLHDALPICKMPEGIYIKTTDSPAVKVVSKDLFDRFNVKAEDVVEAPPPSPPPPSTPGGGASTDRKSTRLNSSHDQISYAVFCLKKKNKH